MSEKNAEAKIIEELDMVLSEANRAEDKRREAEREVDAHRAVCGQLEQRSQQLRRALHAIKGEDKNMGDVNAENNARRRELRREQA